MRSPLRPPPPPPPLLSRDLFRHLVEEHSLKAKNNATLCPWKDCAFVPVDQDDLAVHFGKHHGYPRFQCNHCDVLLKSIPLMEKHFLNFPTHLGSADLPQSPQSQVPKEFRSSVLDLHADFLDSAQEHPLISRSKFARHTWLRPAGRPAGEAGAG
ncbi:hypothetical protein H696_02010 [Fonticula alba]|uniref:C2H2-type domain-containing protein n=1 Tax=Fonticula alba TaxID=691883 RepID=A0A058ZA02_FONAL|nr:hypothetical protein H696_02010 [Fonticula alba]KCV71060.1 hypothetical protein H696_02010 [Fonticula alba]|eukprot:XP_009494183.1 hypothetical protein H696_02010 [Fonticula alba]